ncbi:hypothetical protein P9D75_00445 [Bacillus spizizenii]|nr:hypothetical protein [Bacillus spizizenii]MEC1592174.1 hypothetical protein [Bacillus spizizenii]
MKISRILLIVMVLSSILAISHLDTDNASNGGFKIAADRVGA